jgi:uncharacterized phage protein gp47/JayE
MASSLTLQGYQLTKLEDIKAGVESDLKSALGPGINLIPTQLLGQVVGIVSERMALIHELGQDVYNSQYPSTANGISLDNVVAITGIKRLPGIPSTVTVIASGVLGTVIPQGSQASVEGNPDALFETTNIHEIGAGVDEVQEITFDAVPDAGAFTLIFDGEETASIPFGAVALDVETALNNLSGLSTVSVSGDFTNGFEITFTGADGEQPQPAITEGANTLMDGINPVVISFAETTPGVFPNVEMDMVATEIGPTQAFAGTLTVIETPIAGWESVTNPLDAVLGRDIETDAELRIRRTLSLANPGTATVEAIRSRILQIADVKAAVVYENITMETDMSGRPPKSFEAVVLGATDQEIADLIWAVKPAGIESYGSELVVIVDSQGFVHNIEFSRPVEKIINLELTVTTDVNFPVNGDLAIVENLLDYAQKNLSIGDDVIRVQLFCPVTDVEGVVDVTILMSVDPDPVADVGSIAIAEDEIAIFDSGHITVNIV